MKALDLCAGIGGFRMGLARVGIETIGWAEIDKDAQRAYRSIYGTEGEFFHPDVMDTEAFSPLIGKVDIVTAGFPCQPYSQIGKQKGLQDPRGGVIFGIEKICRLIKPRWILLENVPEVLTNDGAAPGRKSSVAWQEWGTVWNGKCLTQKISASRKIGAAVTFSSIAEGQSSR